MAGFTTSTSIEIRWEVFYIECGQVFRGQICQMNSVTGVLFPTFQFVAKKGVLNKLFEGLVTEIDTDWLFIDRSIVKARQDSSGAASEHEETIGKSRGGHSTKIHLAVDSGGMPIYIELSGGQVNDIVHAQSLIEHVRFATHVIGDRYRL